jgi:hypothetical protein
MDITFIEKEGFSRIQYMSSGRFGNLYFACDKKQRDHVIKVIHLTKKDKLKKSLA